MKKRLELQAQRPCCGYIQDVEYVRRQANPDGQGIPAIQIPLYMQLLLPTRAPRDSELLPLVVYVVGGGYRAPKVHFRVPWLSRLAERGFVVAMPQYRGTEVSTFLAMVEDVRSAVSYLRLHAKEFGADPQKLVLAGGSAGAHAALLAAYGGDRWNAPTDVTGISTEVCGVIDMYGPTELARMITCKSGSGKEFSTSMPVRLTGCYQPEHLPEQLAQTSVCDLVSADRPLPPTLIVHGDRDELVPLSQSELLYDALHGAGKDVELYCLAGATHADMLFFQSEMMDIYEAFVRRVTRHQ